jgi:creatinine amidohydrolase
MKNVELRAMSWVDVKELLKETDMVILPVGTIENNGPHLPLSNDGIVAEGVANRLAEETGIPVAPMIPWGESRVQMGFPGTITIRADVLAELVRDIALSLKRHGFRRILAISPHAPNQAVLGSIGQELREEGILFVIVDFWNLLRKFCMELAETKDLPTSHGSELFASTVMAFRPEWVDMSKAVKEMPGEIFERKYYTDGAIVTTFPDWKKVSKSGITGDPIKASKEKGEEIVKRCMPYLVKLVKDMLEADLPDEVN